MAILGGVLFIIIGVCFAYYLGGLPLRQLLTYRVCQIRHIKPHEPVYLAGFAGKTPQLTSPLSQSPCIKWRIQVSETTGSGKSRIVIKLLDIHSDQPYFICDRPNPDLSANQRNIIKVLAEVPSRPFQWGLGPVTVGLPKLALDDVIGKGTPSYQAHQNLLETIQDERARSFLVDRRIPLKNVMGLARNLSINEYILKSDQPIYIWGQVVQRNRERCLIPSMVSQRSREFLVWASLGFGLLGGGVVVLGGKVIYELALR